MEDEGLIKKIAYRFYKIYGNRYELEDLIQQCWVYYLESKKHYNESKGAKFTTYAWSFITKSLQVMIRDDKYYPAKKREDRFKFIEVDTILNSILKTDDKDIELIETLQEEDKSEDIYLNLAIEKLNTEEKKVIHGLFYQDKHQYEVAEEMGTYQIKISRINKAALNKLKYMLTA